MEQRKIIKIIVALILIFVCLLVLIVFILNRRGVLSNKDNNQNNTNTNNVSDVTSIDANTTPLEVEESEPWIEKDTNISKEYEKLTEVNDLYTYFLIKQCITNYYNAETIEKALSIIDTEAKEALNINQDNVSNLYNNYDKPQFCIDKIYKQSLNVSKDLYVVYHRLQKNLADNLTDTIIFIKIDNKNISFSVYPYEYLKQYNYLGLGQDDVVTINNLNDMQQNNSNKYKTDEISKDDKTCMQELHDRYKFDVQFDTNRLYNKLDEEYRKLRFPSLNIFLQYIDDNKRAIINQDILKYKISKDNEYKEYLIINDDNTHCIFNMKNLMDYKIKLDNYTITPKVYNDIYGVYLPNVRGKYCIDRIITAINDKNYNFVYEKLNPIQKNNYYRNINDFEKFIEQSFFDKNNYEVEDEYLKISSDVYQYDVKIKDATEKDLTYKKLTMTVTMTENMDFYISITK